MKWLIQDSVIKCPHPPHGEVQNKPSQSLVTIAGRPVLVETDPEKRPISMCSNVGPAIKPCTTTLVVEQGYSGLLRVEGHRVCLDTLKGKTDGTPPGTCYYTVKDVKQTLVESDL